jgi:hypothetical protein
VAKGPVYPLGRRSPLMRQCRCARASLVSTLGCVGALARQWQLVSKTRGSLGSECRSKASQCNARLCWRCLGPTRAVANSAVSSAGVMADAGAFQRVGPDRITLAGTLGPKQVHRRPKQAHVRRKAWKPWQRIGGGRGGDWARVKPCLGGKHRLLASVLAAFDNVPSPRYPPPAHRRGKLGGPGPACARPGLETPNPHRSNSRRRR